MQLKLTKLFNRNSKLRLRLPLILFVSILVLSLLVIFVNRGLYLSRYEPQIVVELDGTSDEVTEAINTLASRQGVVRVDRMTNSLYFQNVPHAQVSEEVTALESVNSGLTATTKVVDELQSYIGTYAWIVVIITLTTIFTSLYRILRIKPETANRLLWHLGGLYIVTVVTSNIIMFGILSFLSRFYQIKELDLLSLLLMNLYLAFRTYKRAWALSYDETLRTSFKSNLESEKSAGQTHVELLAAMLLMLAFALTPAFVLHGLLVIAGVALGVFSNQIVLDLYANGFKMKKITFRKPKVLNRVNIVDGKELFEIDKTAKKHKKKKKRKK